jgi:ketosteroid isomerase-like protein
MMRMCAILFRPFRVIRVKITAEYPDHVSRDRECFMATIRELLTINLRDVFGNRDASARRRAIDEIFTDDVVFVDPDESSTGRDALEAKAAGLIDGAPADFVFVEDGVVYEGAGSGALAWTFGPSGSSVARGIDIITVRDGRISELRTLLHVDEEN